jgi:rhamnose transport system permease protein
MMSAYPRETPVAVLLLALLAALAFAAPAFYSAANLRDLLLSNAPVLICAIGSTLVILTGEVDISIGSQLAVLSIAAGALAKTGLPPVVLVIVLILAGGTLGAVNGILVAGFGIPSIVVTLATMMAWRETLRWSTEGAWVQNLPDSFQWFGLGQSGGQTVILVVTALVFAAFAWSLRNLAAGRAVYAAGSDREAARLAGLEPRRVVFWVFTVAGMLVGIGAVLATVRFHDVPANAGIGLELKCITAVVIGGTAISGGRGTLAGTLAGVALLGVIGTALIFAGVSPYWEKAAQGAIILGAVASDYLAGSGRRARRATA